MCVSVWGLSGSFPGPCRGLVGLVCRGPTLLRSRGQSSGVRSTLVAIWLHLLHAKAKPPALGTMGRGLAVDGACGGYRGRLRRSIHPNKSSRHSSASIVPPTPIIPTTYTMASISNMPPHPRPALAWPKPAHGRGGGEWALGAYDQSPQSCIRMGLPGTRGA